MSASSSSHFDHLESNTMKKPIHSSNVATDNCVSDKCVPVPDPDQEIVSCLNHSHESWNSLGLTAYSALSIGSALLSVLSINAVVSLLSCNSVFSVLSLNSAFSIFSTNSAFAIGCVDKRFQICW